VKVISFIVSDVIDDPLELIASGPTVKATIAPSRCLDIIKRVGAMSTVPQVVIEYLQRRQVTEEQLSRVVRVPVSCQGKKFILCIITVNEYESESSFATRELTPLTSCQCQFCHVALCCRHPDTRSKEDGLEPRSQHPGWIQRYRVCGC
jgi:hypothetical protein